MSAGKLYIVATPIGNLDDLPMRAIELLRSVDLIACEDTRHSGRLFKRHGISARLVPYHDHNEQYGYYGWNGAMPYAQPMYMVDGYGRIASYYYTTGWTGTQMTSPLRTLLLVASRRPLRRVTSPEAAQHWLQQTVGFQAISHSLYAPQSMLTDIVDAILPDGAGEIGRAHV